MGDRKDFNQTELLKYLGQFTVNKARCEKCGITALDIKLNLHHRDGNLFHEGNSSSYTKSYERF